MIRSIETPPLEAGVLVLKALGEPNRLRIAAVLDGGELCVCHLVELLGLSQPTVSRHLAVLRAAGVVRERRDGRWSHYRLDEDAGLAAELLARIGPRIADDPDVLRDRAAAEGMRRARCAGGGR